MNRKFAATMTATIALMVAGCASGPRETPEIISLQQQINESRTDRYIAEHGRAELQLATENLEMARQDYRKNRDMLYDHHLEMTTAYLSVADTRGDHGRTKAQISDLQRRQDELRLASRDRDVLSAQQQTGQYRSAAESAAMSAQNAERNAYSAQQNAYDAQQRAAMAQQEAASANQQLSSLQTQLKDFEFQITALGGSLTLRDVMFEVDSAQLRPGADQRLRPLVNYLQSAPDTKISIEGHTDSTGGADYNERLSRERAESVAAALSAQGVDADRIQTAGFGLTKPIASNATVSGREQNRRVEIIMQN